MKLLQQTLASIGVLTVIVNIYACAQKDLIRAKSTAEALDSAVQAACATLVPVSQLIPEVKEAREVCSLYEQGRAKADDVFDAVAACDLGL